MGPGILYLIFAANAIASTFVPWLGIVLAYLIAVLTPQNIWWWAFEGVRPLYVVLVPTLIGFALAVVRGRVSFTGLNTRLNWCVCVLWFTSTVAYYFGPYVEVQNEFRFYDPEFMFSTWQKTCLTYFVAVVLIDNLKKLKAMGLVMIIAAAYMTFWANQQYFTYEKFGRLHGPVGLGQSSIYADENNFAVLFVVGSPFLYYFGQYFRRRVFRWAIWSVIPFSWHAVFLTASRGALLGIIAVLLVFFLRSERKAAGLLVVLVFFGAFAWQAGDLMKDRSSTIASYEQEDSAASRLDAWKAASRMMAAHPITGVGFASFGQAFPYFSDTAPRIAHNTFFQVGGEWGIGAGLAYLVMMVSTLKRLWTNGARLRQHAGTDEGRLYLYLSEASLMGLTGFFVCAFFLSLEKYEVLYFLLVIANGTLIGGEALRVRKKGNAQQI
jgi:probable O-glycosylation ligase (exosortase A-associated)